MGGTGGSSCQGSPGHVLGLGVQASLPRGSCPCHLIPQPEKGHRAGLAGEGPGVGGGGCWETPLIIAVRCSRNTRSSWETCWGRGAGEETGQRLHLVLRTSEHISSL